MLVTLEIRARGQIVSDASLSLAGLSDLHPGQTVRIDPDKTAGSPSGMAPMHLTLQAAPGSVAVVSLPESLPLVTPHGTLTLAPTLSQHTLVFGTAPTTLTLGGSLTVGTAPPKAALEEHAVLTVLFL